MTPTGHALSDRQAVLLYLVLSFASGFVDLRMRTHPDHPFQVYIPAVLEGTSGAPSIYRVLVPMLTTWIASALDVSLRTAWLTTRLAWFYAAFCALHHYLRTWFAPAQAFTGVLLVAATLPLTYTNSWGHPDHIAELALFTLGCLAVARGKDLLFAVALSLAVLNRETGLFLVPLYALAAPSHRGRWARTALHGTLGLAIFAGLRVWRGFQHYDYLQLWRNLEALKLLPPAYDPYYRAYAWFGIALFVPLLGFALGARRWMPDFARLALWVVPMLAVVAFTISSIIETRIFTPVFPLVLPAVMFAVFGPIGRTERVPSGGST